MATTQGISIAWGSSIASASALGTITSQGETFSYEADSAEIKDATGNIVSKYWYNYRKKLSLKAYNTNSATMDATPQPGAACTVTIRPGEHSEMAETYVVESCSKERAIDGMGAFSIELIKYDAITAS